MKQNLQMKITAGGYISQKIKRIYFLLVCINFQQIFGETIQFLESQLEL